MAARYIWVKESLENDPCDLCRVKTAEGAVADTKSYDPDYEEGFHILHVCEPCGMLFLDEHINDVQGPV
jgi:hypothetical protein